MRPHTHQYAHLLPHSVQLTHTVRRKNPLDPKPDSRKTSDPEIHPFRNKNYIPFWIAKGKICVSVSTIDWKKPDRPASGRSRMR